MRVLILVDCYYPSMKSGDKLVHDLAVELSQRGFQAIVLTPSDAITDKAEIRTEDGCTVVRVRTGKIKGAGKIQRAIREARLSADLWHGAMEFLQKNRCDLIVFYSPTIFFGPLVRRLKRLWKCPAYLILRDIFPEWAVDLGLLRRGPVYLLFKAIAAFQYAVAEVIGVQTQSNIAYLSKWADPPRRRVEVLHNWLAVRPDVGCSISVSKTVLAGRKIFAYIGNMGVAQGIDIFMELVQELRFRDDIGFLFVGRGSEFASLEAEKVAHDLNNVLFFNEIDSAEIPGLLAQCHVGLVALHPDHKTHNIPGKFVSYARYGLPVLARINAGTDLKKLIEDEQVGSVYVGNSVDALKRLAEHLADNDSLRESISERGKALGRSMFSPEAAAMQIIASLDSSDLPGSRE